MMKVFLSYTSSDKKAVKKCGKFLQEKGLSVWLDDWCLTAGDSLIEKIGEGIEKSDKLVVFLSPESVQSNWVKREVANGLIMEIAEEKGLGTKFVVPALLKPCKIPYFLRDKLYADFTNKSFDVACEELYRGIMEKPLLTERDVGFENKYVKQYDVEPLGKGKYAILLEFGVEISPTVGANIAVDVGTEYIDVRDFFGPPQTNKILNRGGIITNLSVKREKTRYTIRFRNPNITSSESCYLYFEANSPFNIKAVMFKEFYEE